MLCVPITDVSMCREKIYKMMQHAIGKLMTFCRLPPTKVITCLIVLSVLLGSALLPSSLGFFATGDFQRAIGQGTGFIWGGAIKGRENEVAIRSSLFLYPLLCSISICYSSQLDYKEARSRSIVLERARGTTPLFIALVRIVALAFICSCWLLIEMIFVYLFQMCMNYGLPTLQGAGEFAKTYSMGALLLTSMIVQTLVLRRLLRNPALAASLMLVIFFLGIEIITMHPGEPRFLFYLYSPGSYAAAVASLSMEYIKEATLIQYLLVSSIIYITIYIIYIYKETERML